MKTNKHFPNMAVLNPAFRIGLTIGLLSGLCAYGLSAAEEETGVDSAAGTGLSSGVSTYSAEEGVHPHPKPVVITGVGPIATGGISQAGREVAWLGIATEEAPDVLSSQLKLDSGVGLVVTYVAEESPAAEAGMKKNDLLVKFNDQSLVHPAQLRKLVQSREEGDQVRLTFYRSGEEETVEVTLSKTKLGPFGDAQGWQEQFQGLQHQFQDIHWGEALQEQMKHLQDSMGKIKWDQQKIDQEISRAMKHVQGARVHEQALKALKQAHDAMNEEEVQEEIRQALRHAERALKETELTLPMMGASSGYGGHGGGGSYGGAVIPERSPKVTLRSSGSSQKSLVQVDDTGSYVLLSTPRLRLTAHDPEGELLFDGEIETEEQRAEVPPEVWDKVEPMLEKLSHGESSVVVEDEMEIESSDLEEPDNEEGV